MVPRAILKCSAGASFDVASMFEKLSANCFHPPSLPTCSFLPYIVSGLAVTGGFLSRFANRSISSLSICSVCCGSLGAGSSWPRRPEPRLTPSTVYKVVSKVVCSAAAPSEKGKLTNIGYTPNKPSVRECCSFVTCKQSILFARNTLFPINTTPLAVVTFTPTLCHVSNSDPVVGLSRLGRKKGGGC